MARKESAQAKGSGHTALERARQIVVEFDSWLGRGPNFDAADLDWIKENAGAKPAAFWNAYRARNPAAPQARLPFNMLAPISKARIAIFIAAVQERA